MRRRFNAIYIPLQPTGPIIAGISPLALVHLFLWSILLSHLMVPAQPLSDQPSYCANFPAVAAGTGQGTPGSATFMQDHSALLRAAGLQAALKPLRIPTQLPYSPAASSPAIQDTALTRMGRMEVRAIGCMPECAVRSCMASVHCEGTRLIRCMYRRRLQPCLQGH